MAVTVNNTTSCDLIFDIRTIPDVDMGAQIFALQGLEAKDQIKAMEHIRKSDTDGQTTSQRLHLKRVVAFAAFVATDVGYGLRSFAGEDEAGLLNDLFSSAIGCQASLRTWTPHADVIPVLRYRALAQGSHSFAMSHELERRDGLRLLCHSGDDVPPIHELAQMCGLQPWQRLTDMEILEAGLNGDFPLLQDDCEKTALAALMVYLRQRLVVGELGRRDYEEQILLLGRSLANEGRQSLSELITPD